MAQLGFYYDQTTCIGCKGCQIACKDQNNLDVGVLFRRVYDVETGKYPNPRRLHLSLSCNHCAEPKCVANCPTGALYKREEDGIVAHDRDKCIGCRLCTWSCPYGAPQYNEETGKVGKCDLCVKLLEKGEKPACVSSCVMRCLDYGEIDELRQKYGDNADAMTMPSSNTTKPNIVITPKK